MKISTGKVAFPIEFDNSGVVEYIHFNPTDTNLYKRLMEFEQRMTERTKDIQDVQLKADGTPQDETLIDVFEQTQNILREEIDITFGGDISSVAFKHCSPFAIVNGNFFFVEFINALKPEIEKHIKSMQKEALKKMSKYTDKYAKK